MDYIEVSALNGNNINELFEKFSSNLYKKEQETIKTSKFVTLKLSNSSDYSKIREESGYYGDEYTIEATFKRKGGNCC